MGDRYYPDAKAWFAVAHLEASPAIQHAAEVKLHVELVPLGRGDQGPQHRVARDRFILICPTHAPTH